MQTPNLNTPQAPQTIDDLRRLVLVDGLQTMGDGSQPIVYKIVHLRETTVADEREAQRMAERVVYVQGQPQLLVSDAEYRYGMTLRHIAAFECDGLKLHQAVLKIDDLGKLSGHDLNLIEQRIYLIELAAQVRYGLISAEDFALIAFGKKPKAAEADAPPQPAQQDAGLGQAPAATGPVPALLADYAGTDANRAGSGAGA